MEKLEKIFYSSPIWKKSFRRPWIQECKSECKRIKWQCDVTTSNYKPGVTKLFETESKVLVQIHAKGYQSDTHTSE